MNLPNQLTMLRILLIPVFVILMMQKMFLFALLVFMIASFTDFLDGYLARKLNLITNFGKLMDPLADKLLVIAALLSFVESGIMSSWMVLLIVSRELTVSIFRAVAASEGVVIAAGATGKVKTIVQMVMVIYVLSNLAFGLPTLFQEILVWASVILTIVSGFEYIWSNRSLLK